MPKMLKIVDPNSGDPVAFWVPVERIFQVSADATFVPKGIKNPGHCALFEDIADGDGGVPELIYIRGWVSQADFEDFNS